MSNLPFYISFIFVLTVFLTVLIFYSATKKSKTTLIILSAWLILKAIISLSGFYTVTNNMPPRSSLLIFPPIIFIIILFITPKGKKYIDSLNIKTLTILHTIRLPLEIVLFMLFVQKVVPRVMTFEGRNFDIISGITAPLIFYIGFYAMKIGRISILFWNFFCLGLLINIVILAILSAPFPCQKFAFDQPNIAMLYFPYVWLPCCVVPIVLFSHLVSIRQLLKKKI
ncbi:MAG TPA: hypothetical protein VHZ50_14130 [Puia sp.]|nr:hypothetical protein [Puia sp.]